MDLSPALTKAWLHKGRDAQRRTARCRRKRCMPLHSGSLSDIQRLIAWDGRAPSSLFRTPGAPASLALPGHGDSRLQAVKFSTVELVKFEFCDPLS